MKRAIATLPDVCLSTTAGETGSFHLLESEFMGRVTAVFGSHIRVQNQLFPIAGKARAVTEIAVGDFVEIRNGTISQILERKTVIRRRAPDGGPQVLAANVDIGFVVCGLDGDWNERRVERYLSILREGRVRPVVVLSKADLCADAEARAAHLRGVDVILSRVDDDAGVQTIASMLASDQTGVLLGSSGAGKSTLINRLLLREQQRTRAVRESDSRGKHTTTHRELFALPSGGYLIDSPGLREIQLWAGAESVASVFEEVTQLAQLCKFRDCRHQGEPGCAVTPAVDPARLASYGKLMREARRHDEEDDVLARSTRLREQRKLHKAMRNFDKGRRWKE